MRAVLGALFNDAVDEGHCQTNPFRAVTMPAEAPRRPRDGLNGGPRCPSPREVWQLAEAAPAWASPLILIGGFAGLRWGEAIALKPDDVDIERCEIRVERIYNLKTKRFGPPKTAASHRVALMSREIGGELAAVLDAGNDLAFPAPSGGVIDHSNFRKRVWLPLTDDLGLTGFWFHDLRGTYASLLFAQGQNPALVASLMGHSSPAVTIRSYLGYWSGQFEAAKEALASSTAREKRE